MSASEQFSADARDASEPETRLSVQAGSICARSFGDVLIGFCPNFYIKNHLLPGDGSGMSGHQGCWPEMDSVREYREKAVRARRLARGVTDAVVQEQLELAATEYDEIADRLEAGAERGK